MAAPGIGKGKAGDLYLEIGLEARGRVYAGAAATLRKTVDIYPWQAALWATSSRSRPWTRRLKVKIPAGIQSGGKLRLAARGYPMKNGKRGALSLVVRIMNPAHLTADMKALYEQLAETGEDGRGAVRSSNQFRHVRNGPPSVMPLQPCHLLQGEAGKRADFK